MKLRTFGVAFLISVLLLIAAEELAIAPADVCGRVTLTIQAPVIAQAGNQVTLLAKASCEVSSHNSHLQINWLMTSPPIGSNAQLSPLSGEQTSFLADVVGGYIIAVTAEDTVDSPGSATTQLVIVTAIASQFPATVQELALIFGLDGNGQLQTFPGKLTTAAGNLKLFLTTLDRAVTIVIRRQGAQVGAATALVQPSQLAILEVQLAHGMYSLVDQSTNSQLGQIEVR